MGNKQKNMHQIREILRRLSQGESERSISRHTGYSRTTIRDYKDIVLHSGSDYISALSMEDESLQLLISGLRKTDKGPESEMARKFALEGKLAGYTQELNKSGVTKLILWQEYKREHPQGYGYTQFCYHLAQYSGIRKASMHLVHIAGDCMMVDYAGDTIGYIDPETGELIQCQVLVCVLPYSGYTFAIAMHSQRQHEFVDGMSKALVFLGGIPKNIKMDNLKSGVKKANRYEPEFNDLINSFSTHFGVNCTTSRVARPQDKASVENAVNNVYRRIYAPLRNRAFYSLGDLNAAIAIQLDTHNNTRFQNKPHTRAELFKQEFKELKALPQTGYEYQHCANAKVQRNYHVLLGEDKHFYSVPHSLIGKTLKLVYTNSIVEIYDGLSRVAFHNRINRSHGYTTLEQHMPEKHKQYLRQLGWDADYFLKKGNEIGPHTYEAIGQLLKSREFVEQTYNACLGVLRLEQKYGRSRLENACERALITGTVSYGRIKGVLDRNVDRLPLPQQETNQLKIPLHDNIRGAQEYQ
jgi:transposase